MPEPGNFAINGDGQFVINADGSWALFDASGACDPCCGGGTPYPTGFCVNRHPLQRTFVCPLNNQSTTLNARNSWSDGFAWAGDIASTATVPAPCDNHLRFNMLASNTAGATTLLAPAVYGGANRLVVNAYSGLPPWLSGYVIELWNGGGPIIETVCEIDFCRAIGASAVRPTRMTMGLFCDGGVAGNLGTVSCSGLNWIVNGQNYGPTQENDRVRIYGRMEVTRLNATTIRRSITTDWSIRGGALSGSYSQSIDSAWAPAQLPDLCIVRQSIGFTPGDGLSAGVFDNYSGSVINPVHIQP